MCDIEIFRYNEINIIDLFLSCHKSLLMIYFIDKYNDFLNDNKLSELKEFFENINNNRITNTDIWGLTRCNTTVNLLRYFLLDSKNYDSELDGAKITNDQINDHNYNHV